METTIGSRSGLDFDQQRREIRNLRKLALVISLTASQILIIFPLFVCAKIYLYHELHWTWLVILPQISAALWLLLVPFHARLQGFLLLSTPSFVCLALQSPNTYWGCHAALFPFFLSLLGSKKVPLGLIVSLQLHLEGLLALFHNPNLVSFPIWPSPLGITTFILMTLGTIILPLAVLSVAYLTHQATKTMLTIATSWVTLCTFLSFDAVNRELVIPFYLYATFVVWIGACVTLDGLLVYVAWRTRLSRIVGSFIPEPALDPPPSRIARARGLANREIRELPIMVFNRGSHDVPYDPLCTICQEVCQEGRHALLLPACHHVFHPDCVIQWLKRKPVCPNCNLDVREGMKSTRASLSSITTTTITGRTSTSSSNSSTAERLSSIMGSLITGRHRNRPERQLIQDPTNNPQIRQTNSRNTIPPLSRSFPIWSESLRAYESSSPTPYHSPVEFGSSNTLGSSVESRVNGLMDEYFHIVNDITPIPESDVESPRRPFPNAHTIGRGTRKKQSSRRNCGRRGGTLSGSGTPCDSVTVLISPEETSSSSSMQSGRSGALCPAQLNNASLSIHATDCFCPNLRESPTSTRQTLSCPSSPKRHSKKR